MKRKILKQYLDQDPALWDHITPLRAEQDFRRCYHDPLPIFDELDKGHIVCTDVARYKLDRDEPFRITPSHDHDDPPAWTMGQDPDRCEECGSLLIDGGDSAYCPECDSEPRFATFQEAFGYCREVDAPVRVAVDGTRYKLFPSGRAEKLRNDEQTVV